MDQFSFEKLELYKQSMDLVVDVYHLINQFPAGENFALRNQLQRSITSVPSNIAEQSGRVSYKEKSHFLEIAFGSLMEAYCQLQIAVRLAYIPESDLDNIKPKFFSVSRMLNALWQSFRRNS